MKMKKVHFRLHLQWPCFISNRCSGIEPFDESFDRHIWSLADQSLTLDGEVAKKRREEPERIHSLMKSVLDKQKFLDEKEAAEAMHVDDTELMGIEPDGLFIPTCCIHSPLTRHRLE